MKTLKITIFSFFLFIFSIAQSQVSLNIDMNSKGIPMSQDLIGAFFEDINYGADGGLYAELIQNRSFEYYKALTSVNTEPLKAWTVIQEGGASVSMLIEKVSPLNNKNTNYLKLTINQPGTAAGVKNSGFNGIALTGNEKYDFSVYLKRSTSFNEPVIVQLKNAGGLIIGIDTIESTTDQWKKYSLELLCKSTSANSTLSIITKGSGVVYLDMVSLFPQKTYKNRKNGLRADLAQAVADLKPRFLRFPGGCISHGNGLENAYRWKETVGDVEKRKPNWNLWGYHQTYGLGFFEFFQYCEDMGAKPLPVIPVGVSCQFRNRKIAPTSEMKPWIDDAVDLVEFANGAITTEWGAVRASMGHPEPFNMEYICLGNEEDDIPEFRVRFNMIADTLKKYCPEIKIIGTSGTSHSGGMYNSLWQFSRDNKLAAVDEHYYVSPDWLIDNVKRYDNFDRSGPKVFIGEYASQDDRQYNAIAEAAYLTGVEKNSDIIELTCYAPLFCNEQNNQWNPDLIRFDNTKVVKTASYYVQQMYGQNAGDIYLPSKITFSPEYIPASSKYNGKVGVGTWATQVQYDDLKITSGETVLFEDNFSSGSSNWQVSKGTFSVQNGVYTQTSNVEGALSIYNNAIETSNFTFTIRAKKTGGNEGFLIPFAYKDANNYYWLNIGGWANSQHAIEKVTNGSKSTVKTLTGKINSNQWYEIKIVSTDESAKCYLDNVLIFEVSTPSAVTASVTEDTEANDLIIKVVNTGSTTLASTINITGMEVNQDASVTLLKGNKTDRNSLTSPNTIKPVVSTMKVSNSFQLSLPPYSFQLLRFKKGSATSLKNTGKMNSDSGIRIIHDTASNTYKVFPSDNISANFDIRLFDTQGKMVSFLENKSEKFISIDATNLPDATYLVKLQCNGQFFSDKLVIN